MKILRCLETTMLLNETCTNVLHAKSCKSPIMQKVKRLDYMATLAYNFHRRIRAITVKPVKKTAT